VLARCPIVTDPIAPDVPSPATTADINHELITLTGLLLEAESALERRIAATLRDQVGIAPEAFEVLLRLSRSPQGRLRMSELSERLAITTGGTTRMMERLERDGLVRRTPSTSDRRVVYAEVTETGRAELERAIGPHLADLTDIFTHRLSAADVADLERGLRALRDALIGED
jgi:DNA-binding MarR family transcriptional regulator